MLVPGRLKKLRENIKPKLSQERFAKKFGIGRSTYSGYETGKSEPDLKTLIEIADFLNVSIDYLAGRTDDPTVNKKEKINREIDLSDENLINAKIIFNNKSLSDSTKRKIIRILQEVLRIEDQEEDH